MSGHVDFPGLKSDPEYAADAEDGVTAGPMRDRATLLGLQGALGGGGGGGESIITYQKMDNQMQHCYSNNANNHNTLPWWSIILVTKRLAEVLVLQHRGAQVDGDLMIPGVPYPFAPWFARDHYPDEEIFTVRGFEMPQISIFCWEGEGGQGIKSRERRSL